LSFKENGLTKFDKVPFIYVTEDVEGLRVKGIVNIQEDVVEKLEVQPGEGVTIRPVVA
jgi:hypothetical protein